MSSYSISLASPQMQPAGTETLRKRKELRKFGLTMAVATPLFFGLILPALAQRALPLWPWIVGAVFAFFGLVAPDLLRIPSKIWAKIGHVLGYVNTRILLGAIFFLIVSPMGLVRRLKIKDPLHLRLDPSATSYRVPRKLTLTPKDMEHPY